MQWNISLSPSWFNNNNNFEFIDIHAFLLNAMAFMSHVITSCENKIIISSMQNYYYRIHIYSIPFTWLFSFWRNNEIASKKPKRSSSAHVWIPFYTSLYTQTFWIIPGQLIKLTEPLTLFGHGWNSSRKIEVTGSQINEFWLCPDNGHLFGNLMSCHSIRATQSCGVYQNFDISFSIVIIHLDEYKWIRMILLVVIMIHILFLLWLWKCGKSEY